MGNVQCKYMVLLANNPFDNVSYVLDNIFNSRFLPFDIYYKITRALCVYK